MSEAPRIVIVGGGFGGLYAAKGLKHARAKVTVLDRRNHHVFQPLLYQVATAGLSAPQIAAPIRKILKHQRNTTVLLADARAIDAARKVIVTDKGEVPYDYAIVATGATHAYFGHDEWARYAPGLKTIEDAFEIRHRVFSAFEAAETEKDEAVRQALMTFVVIGAGPTGVELAGALAEIALHTLSHDFRNIDPRRSRILLVEGADRVLPPYPPDLSEKARAQLEGIGVQVRTRSIVTHVDQYGVKIGEEAIPARTVLWAAGVAASPLAKSLGLPLDKAGRVRVQPDLSVPGHPELYVIGDLALLEQDGKPIPGVAPAAIQGGKHAAKNVLAQLAGQPARPFRYVDKGSLATIGRSKAVADFGKVHLSGFIAWYAWILIHIALLIGFRSRIMVALDWTWAYFTYQRGARLILEQPAPQAALPAPEPPRTS